MVGVLTTNSYPEKKRGKKKNSLVEVVISAKGLRSEKCYLHKSQLDMTLTMQMEGMHGRFVCTIFSTCIFV